MLTKRFHLVWPWPVGIGLAFLAWRALAFVFAGFSPSWLAHALVIVGLGIGFAFLIRYGFRAAERWPGAMLLSLIFLVMLKCVFGAGILRASQISRRAAIFADGAPYCLLTFDRAGRPRPAVSTLDLSPLVMRVSGHYPIASKAWLIVSGRYGTAGYRYVYCRRSFEIAGEPGSFACRPPKG